MIPKATRAFLTRHGVTLRQTGDGPMALAEQPSVALQDALGFAFEEPVNLQAAGAYKGSSGLEAMDERQVAAQLARDFLADAIAARASDVHIEAHAEGLDLRLRVDGQLRSWRSILPPDREAFVTRLKIAAGLSIAEKRLPQDGSLDLTMGGARYDVRVSAVPGHFGECFVLRLLMAENGLKSLTELGLSGAALAQWQALLRRGEGLALVTGPTGAGKTTTLYASLAEIVGPQRKALSVEDPVEYQLPYVSQVRVRQRQGMTFGRALKALLRQAPDVILIGEIRDGESARIAVEAALTGHLVLSSVHAARAAEVPARLGHLGIAPALAAEALRGVLAQRLVRRLCPQCATARPTGEAERDFFARHEIECPAHLPAASGCPACQGKGYHGRLGVFEFFPVDATVAEAIHARSGPGDLERLAVRRTMAVDGLERVRAAEISVAEVMAALLSQTSFASPLST